MTIVLMLLEANTLHLKDMVKPRANVRTLEMTVNPNP